MAVLSALVAGSLGEKRVSPHISYAVRSSSGFASQASFLEQVMALDVYGRAQTACFTRRSGLGAGDSHDFDRLGWRVAPLLF